MGDRVVVRFTNAQMEKPPEVYLHWAGSRIGDIIEKAAPLMRAGDPTYQIARFVGVCHMETCPDQGLSLGIAEDGWHGDQGDNGTVFIDLASGEVSHEGSYKPDLPDRVEFGRF